MRSPDQVMRLERMGAFHQTRLSFMRALLRNLKRESWTFARTRWDLDETGVGVGVYQARGPGNTYSLVCFSHDLPPEKRSDRVIADSWDATFALFDGVPNSSDMERLARNVPLQEAGTCSESELVLSRANRSVRLFSHVVERLAGGVQPDTEFVGNVGYLMRTTAVYGNGKFGLGDRERIAHRPEFRGAFRAELLTVWLIRWFTVDIAEHLAQARSPDRAVSLSPHIRTMLGVGNATGLGMAPFLGTHPGLLHAWMEARETALMRVRSLAGSDVSTREVFRQYLMRAMRDISRWRTDDDRQSKRVQRLVEDLRKLKKHLADGVLEASFPWDRLYCWSERNLTIEGQEMLVSLLMEPHGELVDDLADEMALDELPLSVIDGSMTVGEITAMIEAHYGWALSIDFLSRTSQARFWYVSEEKLEPRLGERFEEPGSEKEEPLAFGRETQRLWKVLHEVDRQQSLAEFLMARPEFRNEVRRVQLVDRLPYAEIRDNLISAEMIPVDLLRCKLSFFGATRFDPRSDRWVRITMYQNAPYPETLAQEASDDWIYIGIDGEPGR